MSSTPRAYSVANVFALTFFAAALGCSPEPAQVAGEALEECRLPVGGFARCTQVQVPEDRSAGASGGRQLALDVVVIPADARTPEADPLFILAGGPGQAATEVAPMLLPALRHVRKTRDVVLVDQRGTGGSHKLDCEDPDEGTLEAMFQVSVDKTLIDACREHYEADLRHYGTPQAAEDIDEVRATLGYEQINVWGGSYGTRLGLEYARRHPERLRTLVLDGAAPLSNRLPLHFAEDGEAALQASLDACAAEPACTEAFGDLDGDLDRLMSKLRAEPTRVELVHPSTGAHEEVTLEPLVVASILRGALYADETAALVPLAIHRAAAGDYRTLVGLASIGASTGDTLAIGLFLSIVCSEDLPRIEVGEAEREAEGTVLGPGLVSLFGEACEGWPKLELPDDYFEPFEVSTPTLVLSGAIDPATPPRWGDDVAERLGKGRHLVMPEAGHGVFARGCGGRVVADFITSADPESVDASCFEDYRRTPFFTTGAGHVVPAMEDAK